MKRIYLAGDISQAQLMVNMLEQQNIPARIENFHQSSGLGELAVTFPEVWLRREQDADRARAIIDNFEARSNLPDDDQICPQCQEPNPASFDLCWACQADLN
jgi:hypothetical protein